MKPLKTVNSLSISKAICTLPKKTFVFKVLPARMMHTSLKFTKFTDRKIIHVLQRYTLDDFQI